MSYNKSETPSGETVVSTALNIGGMTCSNCVQSITSVLQQVPGIDKIDISLMTETAVIRHSEQVSSEIIKETIEDCGFDAEVTSSNVVTVAKNDNAGDGGIEDEGGVLQITLQLFGMTCSNCSNSIEAAVSLLAGVKSCQVSLSTEELVVVYDSDVIGVRDIVELVEDCGFDALVNSNFDLNSQLETLLKIKEVQYWKWNFIKCLIVGSPVVIFGHLVPSFMKKHHEMMNHHSIGPSIIPGVYVDHICEFVLTSYLQFFIGKRFYINAWKSLKHGSGTMDLLICISTSIAFFYSIFSMTYLAITSSQDAPDVLFATTCMLFIFVSFGKWLENKAKGQTSTLLSKLISLTPPSCSLVENFNLDLKDLITKTISVELLQKNDVLLITPGAKIPTDGIVIFGEGDVDESLLTGESMPVLKTKGSKLIGGSVNGSNVLYLKVTQVGENTQLQQIVKLVKDAQLTKAPIQRYADSIAAVFVPSIIMLSIATFIMWYIIVWVYYIKNWQLPIFLQEEKFKNILQMSISVIVVLCPCALGLAAPTLIMVGTGLGATNGILIKSGEFLEIAKKINYILFDKTGTLTTGEFEIKKFETVGTKYTKPELLNIIGNIERNSEHPIGKSLVKYSELYITDDVLIKEIKIEPSMGVSTGVIYHEQLLQIKLGNIPMMMKSSMINKQQFLDSDAYKSRSSATVTYILINDEYIGYIELNDNVKLELKRVIEHLQNHNYEVGMCTGDNYKSLMQVGNLLGISIENIYFEKTPLDKSEVIKNLQLHGERTVAFVGDGTNDAPLLIQLDLGMLISSGTDVAIESADVVLLDKGLTNIISTLDISIRTFDRIKMNFIWAMVYNTVMLPFLMGVFSIPFGVMLNPMYASLSMLFSSISVVVSSLLLKNWKLPLMIEQSLNDEETQSYVPHLSWLTRLTNQIRSIRIGNANRGEAQYVELQDL